MTLFDDRRTAGKALAERVKERVKDPCSVILALTRGGVPVGYEMAQSLALPLEVCVVRRLANPEPESLPRLQDSSLGTIGSFGGRVVNEKALKVSNIPPQKLDRIEQEGRTEIKRYERRYRSGREPVTLAGQTTIIVDDGLTTGASIRAAIAGVRAMKAKKIVVAVPVARKESIHHIKHESPDVTIIAAAIPEPFHAVGIWYDQFDPVTDSEVAALLFAHDQFTSIAHMLHRKAAMA